MKQTKHTLTHTLLTILLITALCSCSNSSSSRENTQVSAPVLGAFSSDEPAVLTHTTYTVPASQTSTLAFDLAQPSTLGYLMHDGTVDISDSQGNPVYSGIFFPVGNTVQSMRLDAGSYRITVRNSIGEHRPLTLFSQDADLECTTIRSDADLRIAAGMSEFMVVEISWRGTWLQAELADGSLTLFNPDFSEKVSAGPTVEAALAPGRYILLTDNAGSGRSGTLHVSMKPVKL